MAGSEVNQLQLQRPQIHDEVLVLEELKVLFNNSFILKIALNSVNHEKIAAAENEVIHLMNHLNLCAQYVVLIRRKGHLRSDSVRIAVVSCCRDG